MADIIVTGYAIRFPLVGMVLAFAQTVAGLHRMGHRVVYLEESGWDNACYNPISRSYGDDAAYGSAVMADVLRRLGADPVPIWYFDRSTVRWYGTSADEAAGALAGCDLLLNLGGVCQLDEFGQCPRTALVDMDPGFTQAGRFGAPYLRSYGSLFTYGTNINNDGCLIPELDGLDWIATVPPVITSYWNGDGSTRGLAASDNRFSGRVFTTVANLDAYGEIDVAGKVYGQKAPEFARLGNLPAQIIDQTAGEVTLELALAGGDDESVAELQRSGWRVVDAQAASAEPGPYEKYLLGSAGEFSVAKEAYVGLRTGWFSDRSVCYLAAGRPIVVQDTGFDHSCFGGPSGGVVTWSTPSEARDAVLDVVGDYAGHVSSARQWAAEVFDHEVVLSRLLDTAGTG